jgi:hypothetical protein
VVQTGIVRYQEEEKGLIRNIKGNIMERRQRLETFLPLTCIKWK